MSNRYYDSYIYAVDRNRQPQLLAYTYCASLGGGYRREIMIGDKCDSVFYDIDAEDDAIAPLLPNAGPDDCRSYFSAEPTQTILQTISEAGFQTADITQLIWLYFESSFSCFLAAEGCVFTSDSECSIETRLLEDTITKFSPEEPEAAVQEVLAHILCTKVTESGPLA